MAERKLLIVKTGSTEPGVRARRGDFEDWIMQGTHLVANRGNVQANYWYVRMVQKNGCHPSVTALW